jgi:pseudaminic acid cytidylyltransferase
MRVVIIPARGGSKRIPRKNIKNFCSKPIIAYPIQAALESGVVDRVVVSTDDIEIAGIAEEYGAFVPFLRNPGLADDYTGTIEVIRDAVSQLQKTGWKLTECACIYATTPLLNSERIAKAQQIWSETQADFVFTAARFSFPIQRALLMTDQGGVAPFDPASTFKRSQDLAPTFHDAGQLYWAAASTWLDQTKRIYSDTSRMLVLPEHLVQDIDTLDDWQHAELLYKLIQNPGP